MSEWCDDCEVVIDPMPERAAWFHVPDPSNVKFAPAGEPLDSDQWASVGWIDADDLWRGKPEDDDHFPIDPRRSVTQKMEFTLLDGQFDESVYESLFGPERRWRREVAAITNKYFPHTGGKP